MQSVPNRVSLTKYYLDRFRLIDLVLNLSSDEIDLAELFVPGSETPGKEGRNSSPKKSRSTQKRFPESVIKAGSTPNPFGHLWAPSQTGIGSGSGTSSPSALQKDGTPSSKPESTKPKPIVFSWEATKAPDSGTVNTKPAGGLFGSITGASRGNLFGTPSAIPLSGGNADTKPPYSGLFASMPNAAAGNSPWGAQTAFQDTSSTKTSGSLFGNPKPATSINLFASAPNAGLGSPSSATTTTNPIGGSGSFAGITPAKNDNSLG